MFLFSSFAQIPHVRLAFINYLGYSLRHMPRHVTSATPPRASPQPVLVSPTKPLTRQHPYTQQTTLESRSRTYHSWSEHRSRLKEAAEDPPCPAQSSRKCMRRSVPWAQSSRMLASPDPLKMSSYRYVSLLLALTEAQVCPFTLTECQYPMLL